MNAEAIADRIPMSGTNTGTQLKEKLKNSYEDVQEGTAENLPGMLKKMTHELSDSLTELKKAMAKWQEKSSESIQHNPLMSVGVAFGVGLLAARLFLKKH